MLYDIAVSCELDPIDPSIDPQLIVALAEATLAHEQAPDGSVSIVMTDDDTVRSLNREFRGVDEPTDVLSFGLSGLAESAGESVPEAFVLPEGAPLEIGEVVISYAYAARTAAATNRLVRDEIALLTVHGVLHLLGHDHAEQAEEDQMRSTEAEILARFGIVR